MSLNHGCHFGWADSYLRAIISSPARLTLVPGLCYNQTLYVAYRVSAAPSPTAHVTTSETIVMSCVRCPTVSANGPLKEITARGLSKIARIRSVSISSKRRWRPRPTNSRAERARSASPAELSRSGRSISEFEETLKRLVQRIAMILQPRSASS